MNVLSIGHTINSGRWRATAASIARGRGDDCDGHFVTELGQGDFDALAEAVVSRDEKQHAQASSRGGPGGEGSHAGTER